MPNTSIICWKALWTYQSLDVVEPKLLDKLLHAKDDRARAAAVRVVAAWHDRLDHPLDLLAARVADDHPQSGWKRCGRWDRCPIRKRSNWRCERSTSRWTSSSITRCG